MLHAEAACMLHVEAVCVCGSHVGVRWVCEEFGGVGAQQYFQAHKDEV
jgi:hypothetical protein